MGLCMFIFPTIVVGQHITLSKSFAKITGTSLSVPSAVDSVIINFTGFANDVNVTTVSPFQVSIDGANFTDSLVLPLSMSGTNVLVFIRTLPNQNDETYRAEVRFKDGAFLLNDRIYLIGSSILPSQAITACTWNIKWFGSPTYCSCDTALSRMNATTILKELDADVIALQEIVSIPQLQKVTSSLGAKYSYVIADYGSQVQSSNSSGYQAAQKLAYIYNSQKLQKISDFGLLRSTYPALQGITSPYYYYASGRWPYGLKLKVLSTNEEFHFFNIHGKAFAGSAEHNRRVGGAIEMADELNATLPNSKIVITGDFNDLLEGAISTGFTVSPYDYMFKNNFKGITLPSLFPGQGSYVGSSSSLIDNYVVSDRAYYAYVPNSTIILKEVDLTTPNFKNTTSDHLPVLSSFWVSTTTNLNERSITKNNFTIVQPNKSLLIQGKENKVRKVTIHSLDGKLLFSKSYSSSEKIEEALHDIAKGVYVINIQAEDKVETQKWLRN